MKNILLAILTITSLAVFGQTFQGGGSPNNPFIIATYDDLIELSNSPFIWQHHFMQTQDIDASATKFLNIGDHDGDPNTPDVAMGFIPLGNSNTRFTGGYEGKGHTIMGLRINRPKEDYVGMFGYVDFADIGNVNLSYCRITGNNKVGGLIGYNNNTDISGMSVSNGDVYGGGFGTGLIVGYNKDSDIQDSFSSGSLQGYRANGGLIGYSTNIASIKSSYSKALVYGYSESGGLIGRVNSANIDNCFATGKVSNDHSDAGGLIGVVSSSSINKCSAIGDVYGSARVGGFVGYSLSGNQVKKSFCTGVVTGDQGYAAGFAARNNASSIKNCYSTGSVYSGIPSAFCVANTDGSSIENCYATGYVKNRGADRLSFCNSNSETSTITNCYFDLEKTGFGTDIQGVYSDENNQNVIRLTTDQFKNKFNFHPNWNIDGAANDAQPWISNPNGKPYLYWQSMSVSNENLVKVGDDKYNSDGNIANPGGLVIVTRNYRYKRVSSSTWQYLTVNSKADLTSLFRQITEFQAGNEYIIQAYVKDGSSIKYYGDAVYVDTRETTLPVSLLEFTAECNGNYIDLNWSTASELNNDFFTVETSTDATNWEVLYYVIGSGTTNVRIDYFQSAEATNGTQYFRLSQTDFDGTYEVLQVVSVSCMSAAEMEVSVYPNPATDLVKVSNAFGCEISIYNSIGSLVKPSVNTQSELDTYTIDISDLPVGVYYVSIRNNGNVETKSVVISR